MKKLVLLLLATLPIQLTAQVNPQKGYIITNDNDTVHGTIDYLTDARNAKACLFQRNGESGYKTLSPSDIRGYRLGGDGIYYVSRLFTGGEKEERLFAEFLLQGGVSLYRYYYDDYNYFGFVDSDGKEVIIRDDKLNDDLSTYSHKLQERRQKVQEIGALMERDNTIANRLWKMDLTSSDLTRLVRQYDEEYCTEAGDCIVFQYDRKSLLPFHTGSMWEPASVTPPTIPRLMIIPEPIICRIRNTPIPESLRRSSPVPTSSSPASAGTCMHRWRSVTRPGVVSR